MDTYGDEGLHKLLRAYGQGLETDDAMRQAIGVGLGDMQAAFDRRMESGRPTSLGDMHEYPCSRRVSLSTIRQLR